MPRVILNANGGPITLKVKVATKCNWFFYYGNSTLNVANSTTSPAGTFSLKLGIPASNTGSEPISLFIANPGAAAEGYRVDLEWMQDGQSRGSATLQSKGPVPPGATVVPPTGSCIVPFGVDYQLLPIQEVA
jgi:hypothetical protein